MSVFKRPGSDFYSYDFRLDGERHSGQTFTSNRAEAVAIEHQLKSEVTGFGHVTRRVLKKARRTLPDAVQRRGHVYMLKSGYFIKIGFSVNPEDRMRTIETATPEECILLLLLAGDIKLERQLHREFSASHYRREWFFLCGKLKAFVAEFERRNPRGNSLGKTPTHTKSPHTDGTSRATN